MTRPWRVSSPVGQLRRRAACGSGVTAPEAVGAHAQVAVGVDRARRRTGSRAGRRRPPCAARFDEGPRARPAVSRTRKISSGSGSRVLEVLVELLGRHDGRLGEREDLDHDALVVAGPTTASSCRRGTPPRSAAPAAGCRSRSQRRDRGDQRRRRRRRCITSSSSSSMRSASAATCCFSSETLTMRAPSRAWRKKVRAPGSPTVPATKRSGGSKRVDDGHATHPRTRLAATGPGAPADRGVVAPCCRRRAALLRRRRRQPGQVAGVGVGAEDEGAGLGVAHDRHRRRVDVDALEEVEVRAERVGQDRLDDVAVAHREPDRAGAVLGLDRARRGGVRRRPRGPASPRIDSPPGKVAADGWACTVFQSFSLARSFSGRPCHSP